MWSKWNIKIWLRLFHISVSWRPSWHNKPTCKFCTWFNLSKWPNLWSEYTNVFTLESTMTHRPIMKSDEAHANLMGTPDDWPGLCTRSNWLNKVKIWSYFLQCISQHWEMVLIICLPMLLTFNLGLFRSGQLLVHVASKALNTRSQVLSRTNNPLSFVFYKTDKNQKIIHTSPVNKYGSWHAWPIHVFPEVKPASVNQNEPLSFCLFCRRFKHDTGILC